MITIAAKEVEAALFSDGFEECGLSAAVLADEEGDIVLECDMQATREAWNVERVATRLCSLGYGLNASEKRYDEKLHSSRVVRAVPSAGEEHVKAALYIQILRRRELEGRS